MRHRTTVVAVAVLALLLGFATSAMAEEEPATGPELEAVAAAELPECGAAASTPEGELTLAALDQPIATSTCWVENQWQPDSCTCNGWVRDRLYQRTCCPWGCSSWLITSSTRCSNKPCIG